MNALNILLSFAVIVSTEAETDYLPLQDPWGSPLFLSYINRAEARERAEVPPILGVQSYAGYITVNEAFNSNLFFWFVKALVSEQIIFTGIHGG